MGMQAQEFHYGAKTSGNITTFSTNDSDYNANHQGKYGFDLGLMAEYMFNEKFALAAEAKYATAGDLSQDQDNDNVKYKSKLSYIQIPIMVRYYLNDKFSLQFGPQLGFLTSAKTTEILVVNGEERSNRTYDVMDYIESTDLGLNFGLGYKMENGLFFNLSYTTGLSDIAKDSTGEVKNEALSFGIGYFFN